MSVSVVCRVALVVLSLAASSIARAQASGAGAVIRGIVLDPANGSLGYSVVSIAGTDRQILTDDAGRFVFAGLAAGSYRVRARHLGFLPLDTTVTLTADGTAELQLRLTHLTVQLSEMRVVAPGPCRHPGVPDESTDYWLATVFGQLRENADRAVALATQYPFTYQMQRRVSERTRRFGEYPLKTDTVMFDGDSRWPYHPGRMISPVNDHGRMSTQLNIPGLVQLADSSFHAAHCFTYGGVQKVKGKRYIRIDFEPFEGLDSPDIIGTAYLDPDSYQVRRIVMSLTQTEKVGSQITALTVTSTFRELVSSILVLDSAEAETTLVPPTGGPPVVRVERQKNVDVHFIRATPPGAITSGATTP
ncbi:MAG: carboxypeptidase-like regulatory domain-containing protein [Gemmatimonadaceae bacterium]